MTSLVNPPAIPAPMGPYLRTLLLGLCTLLAACSSMRELGESQSLVDCSGLPLNKHSLNREHRGLIVRNSHSQQRRLYLRPCYREILTPLLTESEKPFVLFVHGRGRHPGKEVGNDLLGSIERQYDVRTAMFTWPSWQRWNIVPVLAARDSALELQQLLRVIQDIQQTHNVDRKLTILSHSMGAFVMSQLDTFPVIADNLLISAAAAEQENHHHWVDRIGLAERVYILTNRRDITLNNMEGSYGLWLLHGMREDKSMGTQAVKRATPSNISNKAVYIDFTEVVGTTHRYYINQNRGDRARVFHFYNETLNGEPAYTGDLTELIPDRVYLLGSEKKCNGC